MRGKAMNRLILSCLSIVLVAIAVVPGATAQNSANSGGNGSLSNYPYGSKFYQSGTIITPSGQRIVPTVTVPRGDGSTTYYYSDGSSITVNRKVVQPTGSILTPGSLNGGIRDNSTTIPPVKSFYAPETFK